MSKLVKLPNGPYIKADSIEKVGEVWDSMGKWNYSISYRNQEGALSFHTVELNPDFIKEKADALCKQDLFVNKVNESL